MSEREEPRNCVGCRMTIWSTRDTPVKCDKCGADNDPRIYAPSGMMWRDLFESDHDDLSAWDVADGMRTPTRNSEALILTMKERGQHRQATLARERLDAARRTT